MSRTYRKRIDKPYVYEWLKPLPFINLKRWLDSLIKNNDKYIQQEVAKHYTDAGFKGYYRDRGPHWFRQLYMNKPMRRRTKAICHNIKKLEDYEDAPEFPHKKKPKEYYW